MKPRALILFATGTNRDQDVAAALEMAGAQPEIVHINQLNNGERRWDEYQMLVIPGGFSYADALGAGKLLALDLMQYFREEASAFVASGKPVIGICNGFQALVKSGILPDANSSANSRATLTFNRSGHFECRWVTLQPISTLCIWTRGLQDRIECPVAHGEGNFLPANQAELESLMQADQIAMVYLRPDGKPAQGSYPSNPNGSMMDIAGICNPEGNVLGLMPHPENHIFSFQHPHWTRGTAQGSGLPLFIKGVQYASNL